MEKLNKSFVSFSIHNLYMSSLVLWQDIAYKRDAITILLCGKQIFHSTKCWICTSASHLAKCTEITENFLM
uniref:Uncharacterized protein n=1 Tax=Anguilla anguilla TaxID=7936 RepID=A0A0E9SYK0_ANGAN